MKDKKSANRFTIQFNPCDSRHVQVIDILNMQGRKKAQYIVDAILSYESGTETDKVLHGNEQTMHYKIKSIVEQILSQHPSNKRSLTSNNNIEPMPKNERKIIKTEIGAPTEAICNISDDDFDMINSMVDSLKND